MRIESCLPIGIIEYFAEPKRFLVVERFYKIIAIVGLLLAGVALVSSLILTGLPLITSLVIGLGEIASIALFVCSINKMIDTRDRYEAIFQSSLDIQN